MENEKDIYLSKFANQFDKLVIDGKMNMNTLEQLMVDNIEEYKKDLRQHVEEMVSTHINERELITKKKQEWKEKGFKLKSHGKNRIELIMVNGKIEMSRTILQIVGDIDLKKYNLKSKLIVPLDEYLGIDKLPFKVSLRAMIEIAFWGQNQVSFEKASEIIYRVDGIQLSYVSVMNITKYI